MGRFYGGCVVWRRVAGLGGGWARAGGVGAFCWSLALGASRALSGVGSRLLVYISSLIAKHPCLTLILMHKEKVVSESGQNNS